MVIQSLKYENPKFQVEVDWDITQRCNYSCSYCASYDNSQPFNFKTIEEYIDCFKYLSDYFGNKTIRLRPSLSITDEELKCFFEISKFD